MKNITIFDNAVSAVKTINKNGQQLGEIRQNLAVVVTKIQNWGYIGEVSRMFCDDFKDCEKDIKELEQIMQEYASYMDMKMQRLKEIEDKFIY